MNTELRSFLISYGWAEERKVNIESDVVALSERGFIVWPQVASVLENLSGLTFPYGKESDGLDQLWFSSERAVAASDVEDIQSIGEELGVNVVPIGGFSRTYMVLMLGEDGMFFGYAGVADTLWEIVANDVFGAIEAILDSKFRFQSYRGPRSFNMAEPVD